MAIRELEFRGINKEYLGLYFQELGADPVTDSFPYIYEAEDWSGQILSEEEISFTAVFKVNSIRVRFIAANDDSLNLLIKNYRYKTNRIGG